jgi:glycosyltransferase involved in cell wall biosynthesis
VRILTVCVSSSVFGAEIVTLKMLEGFKRAGHEQIAVTTIWTDGEFNRRLSQLGIPEVRMPFGMLSKKLSLRPLWWTTKMVSRLPFLWRSWRRQMRDFDPDVVLFTSWRHALALYPLLDDRPSFLIEHSYLSPTRTRRALYRFLARKLRGFIAVSEFLRRHIVKAGAPVEKVSVVRNGVFSIADKAQIEEECSRFQPPIAGRLRLGLIGQIAPQKGHATVLDAIQLLQERRNVLDVYVFGAGDTKYISHLKEKIRRSGMENIFHWMGYEANQILIYGQVDVVVVPSLFEDPFPTVAMEAGAYARPVIASRSGGLPEIVKHGVTGWLIDPGNAKELKQHIKVFLENTSAIEKIGEAAQNRIFSEFTQEQMVAGFQEIFDAARRRAEQD